MSHPLRHSVAVNLITLCFILVAIAAGALLGNLTRNDGPANADTPSLVATCTTTPCGGGASLGGGVTTNGGYGGDQGTGDGPQVGTPSKSQQGVGGSTPTGR